MPFYGPFVIICIYDIYSIYGIVYLYCIYDINDINVIYDIYGIYCMKGIYKMSTKNKSIIIKVEEGQYKQWREEALNYFQAYNFSQFVRDIIEEKLAGARDAHITPAPPDNNEDDFEW